MAKMTSNVRSYQPRIQANIKKLKNEKKMDMELPVKKDCIRP
jgi:hypothetical protein